MQVSETLWEFVLSLLAIWPSFYQTLKFDSVTSSVMSHPVLALVPSSLLFHFGLETETESPLPLVSINFYRRELMFSSNTTNTLDHDYSSTFRLRRQTAAKSQKSLIETHVSRAPITPQNWKWQNERIGIAQSDQPCRYATEYQWPYGNR
jgi:hypothetical protein